MYSARMRTIPSLMATQHPDNAAAPHWQSDTPFISAHRELDECIHAFTTLDIDECMWDWEGKYADESVIDKLFTQHHDFFKKKKLGKDLFLTFRIPNVSKERGYSLVRALMVVLTSEDFSRDLGFKNRPLFEVILPMTETADQLMYIQESFKKLAEFKATVFNHRNDKNTEMIELIPLVEGVEHQIGIRKLLEEYTRLHVQAFGKKPEYIRPFLARSDPALMSGHIANVLANKIALSECAQFSKEHGIPTFPIIGAGSTVFRGGLSPLRVKQFVHEYAGVRTVTLQSAFRYDFPEKSVRGAIATLKKLLPRSKAVIMSDDERDTLIKLALRSSAAYQKTLTHIVDDLRPIFAAVPKRRERRQHVGLLSYGRGGKSLDLPRAITYAGACYSLGTPAEFFGTGSFITSLTPDESRLLKKHYHYLVDDIRAAGEYINTENITELADTNKAWNEVLYGIQALEHAFKITLKPHSKDAKLHACISRQIFLTADEPRTTTKLITDAALLRKALG